MVGLTCCVSVLDVSSCLFQGPCGISVTKWHTCSHWYVYIFWDVTLSLKGMYKSYLGSVYPATKAPGHIQLFTAHVSEALLFLALNAGVCCPCLSSFLLQKVFPNQRGFPLNSGLACKYPFPCPWQLHLLCPTSGEEDASLC